MDVINEEQALVAERAGAVAIMVLERVPSDILKHGNYAYKCHPYTIFTRWCCKNVES